MSFASQPVGRRERNKQQKLDRITAAAGELFAGYGVDEVTTQQIADNADVGPRHAQACGRRSRCLALLVVPTYADSVIRYAILGRMRALDRLLETEGSVVGKRPDLVMEGSSCVSFPSLQQL
jgi:hypothetical protein